MATLYVSEPGVQVHQQGERLILRRSGETLQDIPMLNVDRVILMGRGVSITTPALHALTRRNIEVLFFNRRGGFISRLVGREHRHSRLRQVQALVSADLTRCLPVARAIVDGKVHNQRVLVQRHSEREPWAAQALAQMDDLRRQLDASQNLDELRGREGAAAKAYFYILRNLLRPPADGTSWGFERREYYPPTDPVNALLSFGYTLLLNDLIAACQVAGLDPDLGLFHAIDYNKPAMALDLEEEFRPIIVDSIVLAAINRPVLRLQDFEASSHRRPQSDEPEEQKIRITSGNTPANSNEGKTQVRPVYLKEAARKRFISLYEARVNEQILYPPTGEQTTYRRIFVLQAYQMARMILGEQAQYTAFTVR